ncbi:MAG: cytochrome c oxidase subunit II [Chloroflexi bacterium]|jgi:cytochrome c oxidase subunit 2|nr:cytochrome c oxidase subunit II [Chloroflexota bacterium]
MKRNVQYRRISLALLVGALLWVLALPAAVWAHGPSEGGAGAEAINELFKITLWIAIPIFLLVEGLILFAIIRYRRRSHDEMPEQVHGRTSLEIVWTVLSFMIIAVLFFLTLRALNTEYQAEADSEETAADLTVDVIGYMFNWDFRYYLSEDEPTGITTTKELKIPANRNVLLRITSTDVQHSFWVPDLAGKVDAVPGYINTMWLDVHQTGRYLGQCAEYCGLNHYNMLLEVDVMEPAEFDTWLADTMASASDFEPIGTDMETELPEGDAERGNQIFTDLACNACHGLDDQPSGPALERMVEDAVEDAVEYEGEDAEHFLRESILLPCEHLAEGWSQCIMPQDYGQRLDAQGLADLIAYLMAQGS